MIILRCVYFFLCMLGVFLLLKEMSGIEVKTSRMVIILLINCACLGAACWNEGRLKGCLYGWTILVAVVCVLYRQRFISGYLVIENHVRSILNRYYQINLAQRSVPVKEETGVLLLALFFAVLILLLGRLVVKKGRTAYLSLTEMFIFVLGMLCGCQFKYAGLYILMGASLALQSMGSRKGARSQRILSRAGLWAGGLILVLSLLAGLVLGPILFRQTQQWNISIYDKIQKASSALTRALQSQNGIFGNHSPTADGSLNNYPVDQDEETELRVTLSQKPESSIYLRGFIGDTYEGNYWRRIDEEDFDSAFTEGDADYQIQNILYRYIKGRAGQEPQPLTVERVQPGGEYGYVPYGYETPDDNNLMGDSCYTSVEDQLTYTGYANWRNWLGQGPAAGPESEIESRYQDYVSDQYLKVPVKGLERLREFCGQQELKSVQEVIDYVVPAVQKGRTYSMELEPVPENADFAEYFFFDQKKGYCIHYATTATLMFRMLGVPARYVTGYVAPSGDFVESGNGYTADIPDSQAHAWVEVYRDGKGWIPLEVTPGYDAGINQNAMDDQELSEAEGAGQAGEEPEQQEPEQPTQQPESEQGSAEAQVTPTDVPQEISPDGEAQSGSPDTEPESGSAKGSKTIWRIIGWIAGITGAIAALIAIFAGAIAANRKRILNNRRRRFLQPDINKGIREISYGVYYMLREAGIQEDVAGDIDYARKMEEKLECLSAGEFVEFLKIVQQAAYGPEPLEPEKRKQCLAFYHRIAAFLWGQMTKQKKFWWKYMKCYEIS